MQNFQGLGAPPSDPRASAGFLATAKPPYNCEFLATRLPRFALFIIILVFVAFVLNNIFFIVQLHTL